MPCLDNHIAAIKPIVPKPNRWKTLQHQNYFNILFTELIKEIVGI
jgi:hypothetical protein